MSQALYQKDTKEYSEERPRATRPVLPVDPEVATVWKSCGDCQEACRKSGIKWEVVGAELTPADINWLVDTLIDPDVCGAVTKFELGRNNLGDEHASLFAHPLRYCIHLAR